MLYNTPPDLFYKSTQQEYLSLNYYGLFTKKIMYLFVALNTQGVVLWQGSNLIIYAAKWEGSLARKLKRIGSHRREVDISDAIEIIER